jgi:ATP-binding protein involved in chromosome partitioning
MEDKGTVVQDQLKHGTEWQKNFENVVSAVEKTLEKEK